MAEADYLALPLSSTHQTVQGGRVVRNPGHDSYDHSQHGFDSCIHDFHGHVHKPGDCGDGFSTSDSNSYELLEKGVVGRCCILCCEVLGYCASLLSSVAPSATTKINENDIRKKYVCTYY